MQYKLCSLTKYINLKLRKIKNSETYFVKIKTNFKNKKIFVYIFYKLDFLVSCLFIFYVI